MNRHHRMTIGIVWVMAAMTGGLCLAQGLPDTFGTTTYLKQYPEYQRGYDPWANLSGTLQENVDLYSGKLNLTFPLPTIPWSATKAFGPVLLYNSNVWARSESVSLCIGGESVAAKSPDIQFQDFPVQERPELPNVYFPEYYCNDSWVRFSPIGKPHAMPGWTLTVGGVYTEYTSHPETTPYLEASFARTVKKKYFVAPDGSSHLLVDFETNCRPYFSMFQIGFEAEMGHAQERCTLPLNNGQHLCLPDSDMEQLRTWRALDGSGYYYIEQPVASGSQGNVYGPDGTCYALDANGMISAIRDLDGNVINVNVSEVNQGSPTNWVKTVTYSNWGGAMIRVIFRCRPLTHWVLEKDEQTQQWDWENRAIEAWMLEEVKGPAIGGGEETIHFGNLNLIDHLNTEANRPVGDTIRWCDIFYDNTISPLGGDPMDYGDTVFSTLNEPVQPQPGDPLAAPNRQIFVMTSITLPDGRQFGFMYNRAGKITTITYPDGGSRTYWYGNTPGRSHDELGFFRRAAVRGESPLGGVSMVWQGPPAEGKLERAYAYSNPKRYPVINNTTIDYVSTLLWKGDSAVEVHDFYPQPSGGSIVLDFGFSGWTTGKSKRTRLFDFSYKNYVSGTEEFENRFRCPQPALTPWDPPEADLDTLRSWMSASDTNWLREETCAYRNDFQAGPKVWEWALPTQFCIIGDCYNSTTNPGAMAGFYSGVIPTTQTCSPPQGGGNEAPGAFPDANPVVTGKTLKVRESGQVLTKTFATTWADVFSEPNAVKTLETETDWNGAGPAVRKEYTYLHYWPDPLQVYGGMPGRLLGLPVAQKVTDGAGQRAAETLNVYLEPFEEPVDFHPVETDQWIEGSRWAKSTYEYGGSPLRMTSMAVWDGGTVASTATFVYESGGSKLLKRATVSDGANPVQTVHFNYDPYTGLLRRRTDSNGKTGGGDIGPGDNYLEMVYDTYNRLSQIVLKRPGSGGTEDVTLLSSLEYSNAGSFFRVTRKDYVKPGVWKETLTENDAFGRPAKSSSTLGNEQGVMQWALSWKNYDVLGRVVSECGPAKSASSTLWWSAPAPEVRIVYDALGRVTSRNRWSPAGQREASVTTQYGAAVDGSRGYTVEQTADEMSRWRRFYKDGFGRIVRVNEQNPDVGTAWRTDYTYNTLGNLTSVHKKNKNGGSGQLRTFTYDALGRLLSAELPEFEQMALRYTYDDRGNLLYKRKDDSVQGSLLLESMTYDGLGRILSRTVTHEGRTTCNTFGYDQGTYGKSRLSWDRSEAEGVVVLRDYDYEWRGLVSQRQDVITRNGSTEYFTTAYEYEQGGVLKKASYPSGAVVETLSGPGGVVDVVKVGDVSATLAVYERRSNAPNGAPETVRYAEGLFTVDGARVYDPTTLWPLEMKVGPGVTPGTGLDSASVLFGLSYAHEKNGNVTAMSRVWRPSTGGDPSWLNGTYAYDKQNRLAQFEFTDPRLPGLNRYKYVMDEYGNLLAEQRLYGQNPAPGGMSVSVDATTNRLAGKPHDALGNLLQIDDPGGAPLELSYRDQGHVAEVKDVRTGLVAARYYYDAEGKRRVKERLSHAGMVTGVSYAFYEGEELVCERDAGDQIQPEDAYARKFLLTDHLGTTRAEMTFNAAGNPLITRTHDTMPYGEIIAPDPQSNESVLFTGKQRDAESGLDFFGARFYSKFSGRWISPDKLFADNKVQSPQSWNLFTYANNEPIMHFDPNGQASVITVLHHDAMLARNQMQDFDDAEKGLFKLRPDTMVLPESSNNTRTFVDRVLERAGNDRITELTVAMHNVDGSLMFGRYFDKNVIKNFTRLYPDDYRQLCRLIGRFADGAVIKFVQCGPSSNNDPEFIADQIQQRKRLVNFFAALLGVKVQAPSMSYDINWGLEDGNVDGGYWLYSTTWSNFSFITESYLRMSSPHLQNNVNFSGWGFQKNRGGN